MSMIKLRVFNTQIPREIGPVELSTEKAEKHSFLIGRAPNCDIFLDSATISREHGKISFEDDQYNFIDLGSTNGSQVNNLKLTAFRPFRLSVNDTIQLGDFAILVEEIKIHVLSPKSSDEEDPTEPSISHLNNPVSPVSVEPLSNEHLPNSSAVKVKEPAIPRQYMPLTFSNSQPIDRWTKGSLNLECTRIIDETADVKTFCFVSHPPQLFAYKAGQFLTLELEIHGVEVLRSYSISSSPSRPYTLEITVKRSASANPEDFTMPAMTTGLVSNWLHYNLVVGSKLKASGIFGEFTCFEYPSKKLLFLSAGSGITPMMSMSRWIYDTHADCDVIFFHCARSPQDIIYRHELEMMAERSPKFQLAITVTRPATQSSWLGLRGRLTPAMLEMIAPDWRDRTIFVCGSESFMQSTKSLLENIGFPMQQYHEDSFLKSSKAPVAKVIFNKSGKEVNCDGKESILELAEQVGVKIRSNCRVGSCGSCKKMKLEGEVQMEGYNPEALEPLEKDAGFILCCIAFPQGKVIMDV